MDTTRLECRIFNFDIRLLVILFILFIAGYIAVLIPVIPHSTSTHAEDNIFIVVCIGGMTAAFLLPLLISGNFNHCMLNFEGIKQRKAYCCGLFSISSAIPWGKAVSWDTSIVFNPMVHQEVPQIKIFFRKGLLRLDRTNKKFSLNGNPIDWDHFKAEIISLVESIGIPQATPEPAAARLRRLKIAFATATIILGGLIIFGGILSIFTGKISFTLVFAGTMFFILFSGAGVRALRKK